MGISGLGNRKSEWESTKGTKRSVAAEATSVVLGLKGGSVQIRKSKIKDIARGLAEVAYSMGRTNDPEVLSDEMTETILKAYQKVAEEQAHHKKNPKH